MPDPIPLVVPRQNTNDDQAVLVRWLVPSGTRVAAEQPVVVLETTKTAFDVPAPADGFLVFNLETKIMVDVGATIAWIADHAAFDPAAADAVAAAPQDAGGPAGVGAGEERFSRKALKLLREAGLSPADFPGTGRVEVADVERVLAGRSATAGRVTPSSAAVPAAAAAPIDAAELERSPAKMIEAATLERVYRSVVPSTVSLTLDEAAVQRRLTALGALSGPISLLELVIYEVLQVLPEYPELNGYFAAGRGYGYHQPAVGFAINAGRSLKVPVVRTGPSPTPLDVVRQVRELFLKYMRDELSGADLSGGTFTVTDLSAQDVVHFIPVLYERQSAILGICAERRGTGGRDVVLTIDHRISDGMRAAEFLGALRERLQDDAV